MQLQLQNRSASHRGLPDTPGARDVPRAPYPEPSGPRAASILSDVIAVLTLTLSSVGFAISIAALIFGGALESGLPRAIGSFVVGGGLMAVVVARRSQIVPVATFVQEVPAILMAALATTFIASDGVSIDDVFVLLAVTMVTTSVASELLGRFGLGKLGRNLPKPVVGAFVGGTGWLLFKGGFDVMTNTSLGLGDLDDLFSLGLAKFWVPGFVIGLAAWLASRSQRASGYVLGLVICGSVVGFYLVTAIASSLSAVESGGWLLGPFPETGGNRLVTPNEFRTANWSSIAKTAPGILSVVGIACVAQLFTLTGIRAELVLGLDVDAELRTSARANLGAALFGVTPGFHAFGYTALMHRLGATRRAVPVISGCLVVVFGLVGVAAVGYVPRLALGALLVMIGVALLEDWWRGLMRSASPSERLLGVPIVGAVAFLGLLQGIGLGLVAAGVLFIVRYSRVDPIRSASNGRQLRSRLDRSPNELACLTGAGDRLVVIELEGYVFFGSLTAVEDQLRQATLGPNSVDILVVDFANVAGIDSSGTAAIARLLHEIRQRGIAIWVAGFDPDSIERLLGSEPELATRIAFTSSLDAALECAEDHLLMLTTARILQGRLTQNQVDLSSQLLSECEAYRFEAGTLVMAQGAASRGLLIVSSGRLTAFRVEADGTRTRLRSFGGLSVVGEVGLIAGTPRSAEVVAEQATEGWWLSSARYRNLQHTKPELIVELYEFIVCGEAGRRRSPQVRTSDASSAGRIHALTGPEIPSGSNAAGPVGRGTVVRF